jgi:hypothetical protein
MRALPSLVILSSFAIFASACANPASPARSARPTAAEIERGLRATSGASGAALAPVPVRGVDPEAAPTLVFTEIRGLTAEQTGALFAPTQDRLETCRPSTGGKLVVQLRSEGGRVVPQVVPGASLDPSAQRCVLETLSQTHINESSNLATGAYVRPTGFTSILSIEW